METRYWFKHIATEKWLHVKYGEHRGIYGPAEVSLSDNWYPWMTYDHDGKAKAELWGLCEHEDHIHDRTPRYKTDEFKMIEFDVILKERKKPLPMVLACSRCYSEAYMIYVKDKLICSYCDGK